MYFKSLDYPVIIIDADYDSPRINGILIRALAEELRGSDQRVLAGLTLDDARAGARCLQGRIRSLPVAGSGLPRRQAAASGRRPRAVAARPLLP